MRGPGGRPRHEGCLVSLLTESRRPILLCPNNAQVPSPVPAWRKIRDMNKTHSFFQGKAVLITGASSGIGEELAWQLGQAGAQLTLTSRRKELLEKLAKRIAD